MFGRKTQKSKLDPRVRYQHQSFTKKLSEARSYKRTSDPVSEDGFTIWEKLGLSTRFSKAGAGVVVLGLIYLIFIPNFLSVKNIMVEGAGTDDASTVRAAAEFYINQAPFYAAQRNLIFLNKDKLRQALQTDPKIYKATTIKKNLFRRAVYLTVEMRTPKYVANRNNTVYVIYNDGIVQDRLNIDPAQWLSANPGTIKIKDETGDSLSPGTRYLSDNFLNQLNTINDLFNKITAHDIDYFSLPALVVLVEPETETPVATDTLGETPAAPTRTATSAALPLKPEEIDIFAKKKIPNYKGPAPDFMVKLDTKQDFNEVLNKLQLLLSQTPADRYNRLFYIDMRFADRGFVCLVNTPCAQATIPAPQPEPIISPTNQKEQ